MIHLNHFTTRENIYTLFLTRYTAKSKNERQRVQRGEVRENKLEFQQRNSEKGGEKRRKSVSRILVFYFFVKSPEKILKTYRV